MNCLLNTINSFLIGSHYYPWPPIVYYQYRRQTDRMILIPFNRNWELLIVQVRVYCPCAQNPSVTSHLTGRKNEPQNQIFKSCEGSFSLFPCSLQWSLSASLKCPQSHQACFHLKADGYEASLCQEFSFSRYTRGLLLHLLTGFALSVVFCCCCNTSPKTVCLKTKKISILLQFWKAEIPNQWAKVKVLTEPHSCWSLWW